MHFVLPAHHEKSLQALSRLSILPIRFAAIPRVRSARLR